MKAALAIAAWVPLAALAANAIPTFESLGLYWAPPADPGAAGCEVRYRRSGAAAWKPGLNLWYDARNGECRGSLVHLQPGTQYEVELGLPGEPPAAQLSATTWSEFFPVARTVQVESGAATLRITEGGTPGGYVLYTGPATLDALDAAEANVEISAPYVIVRGLTLKGARVDAIRLLPGAHDVVIERNDISGWGRRAEADAAVMARCTGTPRLERLVVQRNRLHHPRHGANSWDYGPPRGPHAVRLEGCGGNHVIRYNEISSEAKRYFADAIGGASADSDLYGNRISHAWDDAIEAQGANRNVRIWANYTDETAAAVSTTPTHVGPVYIFRNVMNRSRLLSSRPPDHDYDPGRAFAKAGSLSQWLGGGRRYVLHNTLLQAPPAAGSLFTSGAGLGLGGGLRLPLTNTVSRNNIFHVRKPWLAAIDEGHGADGTNDLDYDLVNARVLALPGAEANGIAGTPIYAPGHGASSEALGRYQLAPASPGYDRGARLANFNDGYGGAAPDMGAHEAGAPPMRFGTAAPAILWSAGMETGDLTEWDEEDNGDSADSAAVMAAAEGIAPKSGNWVLRQSVTGSFGATRMVRFAEIQALTQAGTPFYVSWWHYFPTRIAYAPGDSFSFWTLASVDAAGVPTPMWGLFLDGANFTPILGWAPGGHAPAEGPHAGESGTRWYLSSAAVPVGEWVFFEVMIAPSAQFAGAIKVWMNGAEIFDQSLVKTRFPDAGLGGFAYVLHNAYGSGLTPTPAHQYLDDVTVSLERLGH